jgi:hypothetical protein
LQRSLERIRSQGLGVAVVSYDSVPVLRAFADKHGITFPLLSDEGSKTIAAWGIRNPDATGRAQGVPYPGTFIIDRGGVIASRSFEDAYQERETAASILAGLRAAQPVAPPGTPEILGSHLAVRPGVSDRIAAPGQQIALFIDVTPGERVHVYAPGQDNYLSVEVKVTESPDFRIGAATYPESRPYFFEPLNETVQVFDRPFRVRQDVTLALTPSMRERAASGGSVEIAGSFEYQACDDRVCFRPESIPLTWTIQLAPLVQ